jgi:hypothetical protein
MKAKAFVVWWGGSGSARLCVRRFWEEHSESGVSSLGIEFAKIKTKHGGDRPSERVVTKSRGVG